MNKITKYALLAGGVFCAVKGLDNSLETTRYTVSSPKLPKTFDGFRIVHLSDLHGADMPELEDAVRRERPDLIACTGDMADDKGPCEPVVHLLGKLADIAPTYLVSGNHDLWRSDFNEFEKKSAKRGAYFLDNKRVELCAGSESIVLSGISDPFAKEQRSINRFIENALASLPPTDKFDIALFHRANLLDRIKTHGFDLILSGHMHGGQFRIPYGSGILAPRSHLASDSKMLFPKYTGGKYEFAGTAMIVSRGLGNPMIIPRIYNRPELVVIELKNCGPVK